MTNRFKKILAMLLALVMVFGLVACGQTEQAAADDASGAATSAADTSVAQTKDKVVLEWYYAGSGMQQDTQKVQDYVNELLKSVPGLEHVELHLNCFTNDIYKDQILLAQTAGKQMDLVQTYRLNYSEEVLNGTFIPLTDYLAMDEFAAVKNEIPDWLWDQVSINGDPYVVPVYQIGATTGFISIPDEYAQYADLENFVSPNIHDAAAVAALGAEIEKVAVAVQEAEGTTTKYAYPLGEAFEMGDTIHRDVFDRVSGFALFHGDTEASNLYLTEGFKEACRLAAEWVEKGLLPVDATVRDTTTWESGNMLNSESYVLCIENGYGDEAHNEYVYSTEYGFDTTMVDLFDNYFFRASWAAGGTGITSTCKNPDDAMKLLQLLNTADGEEIYNALVYGLEGVHYEKIDETHIKTLEYDATQGDSSNTYAGWKWVLGNTTYVWLNQGCVDGDAELVQQINNDPDNLTSILLGGFALDLNPVATEVAQVTAVVEEYSDTLIYGAKGADWEAYYNEFVAKMEAAGAQVVLDELNSQISSFLASK